MQKADALLDIYQKRGAKGLPLERVYRHLLDPELFLRAYGKIYRNAGAMTKGTTAETVDGMDMQRIHNIIGSLKAERYGWTPVRRTEIPKANGKMRPLGIPTWSDKLVQEVLRTLLEPYYEQKFSDHSHGFRPNRSCHTALRVIKRTWKGTVWLIEGDIKGCFDNIDHTVLLEIIRRDIHDGRVLRLLEGLLKAGYMADWRYYDSLSGTPQGGIISPLLANIYLNDLDKFVENTLIPAHTVGARRQSNRAYDCLQNSFAAAKKRGDHKEAQRLKRERNELRSVEPMDPDYRRLHYTRYADDFLLGFVGTKEEAENLRQRIREFLEQKLKLTLSLEKTLITHAGTEKAKFLGYEITVTRCNSLISTNGKRSTNGVMALLMPRKVGLDLQSRFSREGKIVHRAELLADTDYTIVSRHQSVMRGIYNFYCMAANVGRRMSRVRWILETSLTKTLASKHKCGVTSIYRRHRVVEQNRTMLRVRFERPDKGPLIATFGGIPFERKPAGLGTDDFRFERSWFTPGDNRAEAVQRLPADTCELCGAKGVTLHMHHIHKLADIDRPGRRPKATWEKIMAARKRKSLAVCQTCHTDIHAGRHSDRRL